jgi:hypothetical protein
MNLLTGLSALLLAIGAGALPDVQDGNSDFQKLHADLLKPEKWEGIPWKGSLLEGRALAAKEKKPLFLWVMDAKPLGSV